MTTEDMTQDSFLAMYPDKIDDGKEYTYPNFVAGRINEAWIDGNQYAWCSPSRRGDWCGYIRVTPKSELISQYLIRFGTWHFSSNESLHYCGTRQVFWGNYKGEVTLDYGQLALLIKANPIWLDLIKVYNHD